MRCHLIACLKVVLTLMTFRLGFHVVIRRCTCRPGSCRLLYHLPHQDELGDGADVLHPKTLEDWGLGNLDTRFFYPYLAEHELVVASVDHPQDETWILFDSGAAANCCPPDFAPEFPLLRLDERAPPLESISGQTLRRSPVANLLHLRLDASVCG